MHKQPNSYYCFICGVKNIGGVHVRFYEVPAAPADSGPGSSESEALPPAATVEILARFTGRDEHQGYPGRMHGGVITGILDETIGRAINIGEGENPMTWGVTAELTVRFRKPVPLGVELTARGRITRDRGHLFEGAGELLLPDGTVGATAAGKYIRLPLDAISGLDPSALGWRIYED
jgi:acyl-coenzyme A thioesterase PaaI-like protein